MLLTHSVCHCCCSLFGFLHCFYFSEPSCFSCFGIKYQIITLVVQSHSRRTDRELVWWPQRGCRAETGLCHCWERVWSWTVGKETPRRGTWQLFRSLFVTKFVVLTHSPNVCVLGEWEQREAQLSGSFVAGRAPAVNIFTKSPAVATPYKNKSNFIDLKGKFVRLT